ncbi:MAG: OsmC family protein [Mycobacterium sp.]|nr:OsmC family protein [Mycobacterium sp.]
MDAAPEAGGTDTGPRPTELLLVGLAGCTAMDVISMRRKMRDHVCGDAGARLRQGSDMHRTRQSGAAD